MNLCLNAGKKLIKNLFISMSLLIGFASNHLAYASNTIFPADTKFESYLPLIKDQRVAVFANSASEINGKNIVDALISRKVNVVKIFSPEHGFSGQSDAGAVVASESKGINNLPIISLYGKKDAPDDDDLKDVDIIIFDIQDVGVRYYTYISSLQKLMEAAVKYDKPLIILDRPNPNAFYIDGPVLEMHNKSFIGMQAIPIVYGMTIGEYARMLVGEKWLDLSPGDKAKKLRLTIIPMDNYTHMDHIKLNVPPSPNLPNMTSIYLYPSLGWFEGTKLSVGRGTQTPFQVLGNPRYKHLGFSFIPNSKPGALNPPFKDKICYGWDLRMDESDALKNNLQIHLRYLIEAYQEYPDKTHFFTPFFTKLAGTYTLQKQVIAGYSESKIRASWQPQLEKFKKIRKKYLIYQ